MAPWKSAGWLKWKWWRLLELINLFFHKASPLKPLNLWWKNHVSQWFAFAASAFQLRKTSRELSEGSFRRSASRCSQVLIFSSPTRFWGLWSSHFDDFRNLTVWSKDPVVPKARTQAGGGRSKTPPGDSSCVESGTVSEAPGYSYAPCKSDVEAVNDRFQTGSSVGVHFQVHANCWEFQWTVVETTPATDWGNEPRAQSQALPNTSAAPADQGALRIAEMNHWQQIFLTSSYSYNSLPSWISRCIFHCQ